MFARARSEEDGPLNAVPLVGGVPSPSSALRAHRLRTIGLAGALLAVALVALAAANMPHAARGGAPARVQTQRHAASSYAVAPSVLPELDSYGFPVLTDVLPKDGSRVVWGICGPGRIAGDFTAALSAMGAKIGAVGAGSLPNALDRATDFARLFRIPRAYGSYEELARDSSVQAVYIATTNNAHFANARLMLLHGKHVLLEKPATVGSAEFAQLVKLAAERDLLFVTNFWTRFFPAIKWAKAVARSGLLGDVVHVQGDMAFQAVRVPGGDRFSLASLGGGAMLDMGCYLVQFAALFLPQPVGGNAPGDARGFDVRALGQVEGGVDTDVAFVVAAGGASASFGTSLRRSSNFALSIYCAHGKIEIDGPANCPVRASYALYDDAASKREPPVPCCGQPLLEQRSFVQPLPTFPPRLLARRGYPNGMGFAYAASAFERCLYTDGCRSLDELPTAEQQLIVDLTAEVFAHIGIYQNVSGM